MRAVRTLFAAFIATAALTLAACASSGGTQAGDADAFNVPIEVENNMSGLGGTSIYISRTTGSGRRLLGPVESGEKKTFNYDARPGTYRLIARQSGVRSDSVVSDQFQLSAGMVVQWSLAANRLITGTR